MRRAQPAAGGECRGHTLSARVLERWIVFFARGAKLQNGVAHPAHWSVFQVGV